MADLLMLMAVSPHSGCQIPGSQSTTSHFLSQNMHHAAAAILTHLSIILQ